MFQTILSDISEWLSINFLPILYSLIIVIILYFLYYVIRRQILRLKRKEKFDQTTAKNLLSFTKISIFFIASIALSIIFIEAFGVLAGIFTVAGGTIIGFAAMNTIGNIIAGLIVMVSRPFEVGDRVMYMDKLADVIDIKLVYTVLKDIDGVIISIPNQKLLKNEIQNYGKDRILRREVFMTADYEVDPRMVEKALLEAAEKFQNILKYPAPRVDLYDFQDYAIKYRLLVYINNSKIIPRFNHDLRKAVFFSCKEFKIDISTPTLIMSLGEKEEKKIDEVMVEETPDIKKTMED